MSQQSELDKWEGIYSQISGEQALAERNLVYPEIASAIEAFIPPGSHIMEAACGSGLQSLELASRKKYQLSLSDFSTQAIRCAQEVFAQSGEEATFTVADVFQSEASPQFDLVFNSGVLEHYAFDKQVAFLQGMARSSKRYVLVLVPNKACYWYWIYRMQTASSGSWPFGYERPSSTYTAAFSQAGLHYLGKRYFAADAIDWAIHNIAGLDVKLRDLILQVHKNGIIPEEQRSYLVGFLASVNSQETTPEGWQDIMAPTDQATSEWPDTAVALAADALALQLAHQDNAALHKKIDDLSAKIDQLMKFN